MVTALDDLVGNVTTSLVESDFYNNTILIFVSDNGGATLEGGNNLPLRGEKTTLFEGGTLVPAFIHSPLLTKVGHESYQMMHITDWLPSLVTAVGVADDFMENEESDMDGMDIWKSIVSDTVSPRVEIVYNIDDIKDGGKSIAALRQGDWKIVQRPNGNDDWIEEPISNTVKQPRPAPPPPVPSNHTYLFNILEDPEERIDLSDVYPDIVDSLVKRIDELALDLVEADNPDTVFAGHPINFGMEWATGWCNVSNYMN